MKQNDKQPRVFAFIDSQNLNIGVQKMGWKMDWRKFRQFLTDKYGVTKAYMFIGYIPENEDLYEQMHQAGYAVVLKPTFDLTRPQPEMLEVMKDDHEREGRPLRLDERQGGGEKRTEAYFTYDEGASERPTQQFAKSADRVSGSAVEQAGAAQRPPVKGNIDAELVLWAMKEMSNYEQAIIVSGDGDFYCLVEYLEQKGRLKNLLAPSGHYSSLYNRYEKYVVRLDQFRRELAYRDFKRRPKASRTGKNAS